MSGATLTLSEAEQELLMRVLTDAIEHHTTDRMEFNALVELRARIGGHPWATDSEDEA